MRSVLVIAVFTALLLLVSTASSQNAPANSSGGSEVAAQRPSIHAEKLASHPVVDGLVGSESVWTSFPAATGFTQIAPSDGAPASQKTEVRVGYFGNMLYVGVELFDNSPELLIIADRRRDASLDESDSFRFIMDTFSDGQNGFVFGTNAAGAEYDAQFTGSSEGGGFGNRLTGGSGGGLNTNWDGSWEVKTAVTSTGWSAEFAIPFSTLRYPNREIQEWGINFQRTIRRNNETAFWSPLERQFNLTRVTHAGQLTDLAVPTSRNLKILPYVLTGASRNYTVDNPKTKTLKDIGVDVKYSLTAGLTLDATYNTDFAQVEVDEQQINLDRFSLFFPEKRPFFLENAGLFAVGEIGEAEMFFSRRIGIDQRGGTVPIVAGARLTGSLGNYKIGLLEMQTERVGPDVTANNFGVVRLMREFANRTSAGFVFTNRVGTGKNVRDDDYNRVVALDGRLGIGNYGTVTGFFATSDTPGRNGNANAGQISATYAEEKFTLSAAYSEVGEDFNPEVGFLRRSDYRKVFASIFVPIRVKEALSLQELRPHINYRNYWRRDGFLETGFIHVDNHWEFKSGYEIHTGYNFTHEGVRSPFEMARGVIVPAGSYPEQEFAWVAMMPKKNKIRLELRINHGGFFGGKRFAIVPSLNARASDKLLAEVTLGHTRVDLPSGDFITNLIRTRVAYSFTPRLYVQGLGQYNDQTREWSMNLRVGWLQEANTGLFVVYNSISRWDPITTNTSEFPGEPVQKGLILKYTYLFDVFK
ncbi:MAG: DUF5916 domain-containing protein [Bacteroidetes bacterium]|nr:DUF5916 domain-containing protein [Bacteroidota bacterium]